MRALLLTVCLYPCVCFGAERTKLDLLLATAASAQGKPYLEARQAILDLGRDALPLLLQSATDAGLTWQQRLVARICYERMTRADDIDALRRYDWRTHPQYDKSWEGYIVGVKYKLGNIAVAKCAQMQDAFFHRGKRQESGDLAKIKA